ncbi:hypothetical protein F0562_014986 [Nyssa sinensis]|uniref:Uncharacterized protein n=1 Tax=Nyssa sinensis TaxID=561372 RepID=A0A5J4ZTM2_9ASTE|nr:hypothetical protein F0562_014986 [Nyssa sinensis]
MRASITGDHRSQPNRPLLFPLSVFCNNRQPYQSLHYLHRTLLFPHSPLYPFLLHHNFRNLPSYTYSRACEKSLQVRQLKLHLVSFEELKKANTCI